MLEDLTDVIREELAFQGYMGRHDLRESANVKVVADLVADTVMRVFTIERRAGTPTD